MRRWAEVRYDTRAASLRFPRRRAHSPRELLIERVLRRRVKEVLLERARLRVGDEKRDGSKRGKGC